MLSKNFGSGQQGSVGASKKTGYRSGIVPSQLNRSNSRRDQNADTIRHYWEGKVECKSPRYGVWGGPPNQGYHPNASGPIEPAQDLANAPRGKISLPAVVTSGLPAFGIAPKKRALRPGESR